MEKKKYDYLIVGSGLFGATFAYQAKQAGKKCLVIDKRPHLGGNVYCENIEGINVHKYGAHIFHTNNKEVWEFVNSIVEFNRYTNSPIANYKGKQYNLPFNMNTFYQMWGVLTPEEAMAKIEEQKAEAVASMKAAGVTEPRNLEEQALTLIGKDIYEALIKGYTEKQWGRKCTELPAFIIKRLPVRFVHDNNYFNDRYQGIPIGGYNKLIGGLLEGVDTLTGIDFFNASLADVADKFPAISVISAGQSLRASWQEIADKLVFTGQLDEYFDYRLGRLDWRTVSFEEEVFDMPNYQGNAVVNYTYVGEWQLTGRTFDGRWCRAEIPMDNPRILHVEIQPISTTWIEKYTRYYTLQMRSGERTTTITISQTTKGTQQTTDADNDEQ